MLLITSITVYCIAISLCGAEICPGDQVWDKCGSACTATCADPYPICMAVCHPTCECPKHAPILHDGQCITIEECTKVKPKCPRLACAESCDEGYLMDANDCPTCQCVGSVNVGELRAPGSELRCPQIECPDRCSTGYQKDADGCMTCRCLHEELDVCKDVECEDGHECKEVTLTFTGHKLFRCIDESRPVPCQIPMDSGPCRSSKPRWYFDEVTNQCQEFLYGGCKGNRNNFDIQEDCQQMCLPEQVHVCEPLNEECTLVCEHGLALDERGCYVCQCGDQQGNAIQEKPACPEPQLMCMMECERGFKKDASGCILCECEADPCRALDNCPLLDCPYGLMRDDYGCKVCYCAEDPCQVRDCGDSACLATEVTQGAWTAHCVDVEVARVWCGARALCVLECEHGYMYNSYGCQLCACRDTPPPTSCSPGGMEEHCGDSSLCHYGLKYDMAGCRTCECLPDPCTMEQCGNDTVCERVRRDNCKTCPSVPRCIDGHTAQRASVTLHFKHDKFEEDDFNKDSFIREFERRVSKIMGIDDEYIRDVMLRQKKQGELSVRFNVVSYGEIDLVQALTLFRNKVDAHEPGVAVPIGGGYFIPIHSSLQAQYSSRSTYTQQEGYGEGFEYEDEDNEEEMDTTMTVIIIACSCGAAVFVIVLALLIITVKRAKAAKSQSHKHQPTPKSGPIYKKAPTSDPSKSNNKKETSAV